MIELSGSTAPFCAKNKVNTMHNECIIQLICLFVQELPPSEVKTMYNLCIIELFCLTDAFYTKKKVNTMHKCIMELVCSPVQESPMSKVKVLYNL